MQLKTFCVSWTFVLFISIFSSAVGYVIRNENKARFEKPNLLQPKYPHERQMVWHKEQKKLLAEFGNDDKDEVIHLHIDNNPSKVNMFIVMMKESAILMNDARLVSKGVRNKRFTYDGGSNGMNGAQLSRNRCCTGGPGRWYGRGPCGGGSWGPPPGGPPSGGPPSGGPPSGGPPPWAWGPPPWAWNSPWGPPPWAWGSSMTWGGQYNQSTVPSQGISTIPPMMPTMTAPGISTAPNQGISTRPPTTRRPDASTTPQGMTTRPPFTTISGQGLTFSHVITPTVQSLITPTTPKQGTPILEQGSITTHPPEGQLIPGQVTTRMPFKHGLIEPDMDDQPTESSGQAPIASASPPEKPDDEQNAESPTVQASSPNEQSSMEHGPTMGPVSQSDDGFSDPAPPMDLNGQNGQATVGHDTSVGSGDQNGQDSITEVSNGPESQINTVQTENGQNPVSPSPSTENNYEGKHGTFDTDQLTENDGQGAQSSILEQSPTVGTNHQLQQGSVIDPAEQGLDTHTQSADQMGLNVPPGQDQMNPGPTEGIIGQSKDEIHDQTGTDDKGAHVQTSGSSEQIQQGSVNSVPEVFNVPLEQIGQNAHPDHYLVDPNQTERTVVQTKDDSQDLGQSETDNQDAIVPIDPSPTGGPDPGPQVGSNNQTPDGSLHSQGNAPESQIEQAPEITMQIKFNRMVL